jgi:hypothetical protein
MATLSFSFNTGTVPLSRIQDAFALAYGYQATVSDGNGGQIPNPETKAQFTQRKIREYVVSVVKSQETEAARRTAESAVTEITLT